MTITVKKIPGFWLALGLASHFVAKREPFSSFPASDLIRTLSGQIRRDHYLFALDTSSDPARVIGYFGWALYDHAVAAALITATTQDLVKLLQAFDQTLAPGKFAELSTQVEALTRKTQASGKELVDYTFRKTLILIGFNCGMVLASAVVFWRLKKTFA